jgi:uroporphyrin-3 C-methyltransferase
MTEPKDKENVVIDVTPEPESGPEMDSVTEPNSAQPPKKKFPLLIITTFVALGLAIGALIFAYQATQGTAEELNALNVKFQQSQNRQAQLTAALQQTQQQARSQASQVDQVNQTTAQQQKILEETRAQLSEQQTKLASDQNALQSREQALLARLDEMKMHLHSDNGQWMVSEAEYLLRLASHRVSLERDLATAREALLLADQRLRDTRDPGWLAVREQIARDINTIDGTSLPDVAGLSAKLGALIEQVPQLKLTKNTLGKTSEPTTDAVTAKDQARTWDSLLDNLIAGFKNTIRVRRNDQPQQAMLAPEQQYFLYENLRLQLEGARLAIAKGDQSLFQDNLNTISNWLGTYFDPSHQLAQAMLNDVNELKAINIKPSLPDLNRSLHELQLRKKLTEDLSRAGSPTHPVAPSAPIAPPMMNLMPSVTQ